MLLGYVTARKIKFKSIFFCWGVGAVFSGVFVYIGFWLSYLFGGWALIWSVMVVFCSFIIFFRLCRSGQVFTESIRAFILPVGVWMAYSLFVLLLGFCVTGVNDVLNAASMRFSHALPIDNQLPFILADQISKGHVNHPMIGDWLSSDRPPLQSAYFIFSGAQYFDRSDVHYQINATLLQTLWVIGAWLLMCNANILRWPMVLAMITPMTAGYSLVNEFFTWPKMLPVFYLSILVGIFVPFCQRKCDDVWYGLLAGSLASLSMLCHGGSIFMVSGLCLYLLLSRRMPSKAFLCAVVISVFLLMYPWSFYQGHIDPPGNRLLKWHLAGIIPIDKRSTAQALMDAYGQLQFDKIIENKLANFYALFGDYRNWTSNLLVVASGNGDLSNIIDLRRAQFFIVFATLGFYGVTIVFYLARLLRWVKCVGEKSFSDSMLDLCLCTSFVWCLFLFGPSATVIHQGSLALVLLLYLSLVLSSCVNRWFCVFLFVLHLIVVSQLYMIPSVAGSSVSNLPMYFASLVFLLLSSVLILVLSRNKCVEYKMESP